MLANTTSGEAVAGGRALLEFFPIEAWQKSSECPFPTVNDTNYKLHRRYGIDTFLVSQGSASKCGGPNGSVIAGTLAPQYDFWALADGSIDIAALENTSRIAGIFQGDESDDHSRNVRPDAAHSQASWKANPAFGTYVGGSRNRHQGLWGHTVDYKGMDFYVAACAPHVTEWASPFWLRGSFDYLRTTAANQAPWPAWLYSQAFDDGWDGKIGPIRFHRQPDPAELSVQLMSVIAAGGKGMMLF